MVVLVLYLVTKKWTFLTEYGTTVGGEVGDRWWLNKKQEYKYENVVVVYLP